MDHPDFKKFQGSDKFRTELRTKSLKTKDYHLTTFIKQYLQTKYYLTFSLSYNEHFRLVAINTQHQQRLLLTGHC